jgi:KDO2-lipid IV(A) lauroyltransferase
MLGISSNAGMASLGRVCAVGIVANMLLAVYVLPVWWKSFAAPSNGSAPRSPSSLYSAKFWSVGLWFARVLPARISQRIAKLFGTLYWLCATHRRAVVTENLLPVFNGDRSAAQRAARKNFQQFAAKLVDLWRFEGGAEVISKRSAWNGWETFETANSRGHGVLIVTPHLGNWEFGAAYFVRHDVSLLVLTQAEPDAALTQLRQASRAKRGIETFVVGEDPFAFVEIIKRLQSGASVALLIDRPPAATGVTVELFGRPFTASIAAAELARASGCAIVPGFIVRDGESYRSTILPEVPYDRATINTRAARIRLTQEIMSAFEPAIREHSEQWYHFVPLWK